MKITPFRGRKLDPDQDAWVYHNLSRAGGPWYSIAQGGIVVAHAREVGLRDVRFVVREAGRRRVISSGRKNVHAFVIGRVVRGAQYVADTPARYNPREMATFQADGEPLERCGHAYLGPRGLTVGGFDRRPLV